MSLGNNRWRGKTSILIVQRFAKRRKCRKVFRIRVRKRYLVSEKLRYIASWFTIPVGKKIYFFFQRVCKSVCHRNRSDRVPGIPELSQENNPRWMKKLNSFLFPLSTPLSPSSGKERERRWLKCSMKFIFVVRRKWKKSFDPRCVKFSYADGIFQQYWLNIGTLDDSWVCYICMWN